MIATERALVDDLIANDDLIAEVLAALKELNPRRRRELIGNLQQFIEEQRATLD